MAALVFVDETNLLFEGNYPSELQEELQDSTITWSRRMIETSGILRLENVFNSWRSLTQKEVNATTER